MWAELKSCPFCGGRATIIKTTLLDIPSYGIICDKCKMSTRKETTGEHGGILTPARFITDKQALDNLIEKWNTRAVDNCNECS